MRRGLAIAAVAVLVVLSGCAMGGGNGGNPSGGSQSVGLAAGGAQDANAFRTNVREGYVPQPTDLTYEGLFHDYYFDTGAESACDATFCPSFSRAVSTDPVSGADERFVTVGLNSGISQADFERSRLNLVFVVDTSRSMESPFDQYYYDGEGQRQTVESTETKMAAARDAMRTMTGHLDGDDRVGIVAFDDRADVVQDLQRVDDLPDSRLEARIGDLRAGGGTNLDAGMRTGVEMLRPHAEDGDANVETRIVYLTDAQPNLGDRSAGSLGERLSGQAAEGIHTSFVGVGVDFNSRLLESIYSVRGANYYAVHSPRQFRERMVEGFDYMVTPLVYDLSLSVDAEGYRIEHVYGTDSDDSTERLVHVNTLFPSRREGNRTEGGVTLLELERTGEDPRLTVETTYEDRAGETHQRERTVTFDDHEAPYYETSGVRKAVALARYGAAMRNWAAHERAQAGGRGFEAPEAGIDHRDLGQWEQQSVDLRVSPPYDERLRTLTEYLRAEREALGADRLDREIAILENVTATAAG